LLRGGLSGSWNPSRPGERRAKAAGSSIATTFVDAPAEQRALLAISATSGGFCARSVQVTSNERSFSPVRGVIEGFYGRPFTHDERRDLLRFVGAHGMNTYVYAPKNDPLHRDRWREPYPREELARFAELAREASSADVRMLYAIAPGLSYDAADEGDFVRLEDKIRAVLGCGVHGIALLFDDLTADSTTLDPGVQADLIARTAALVESIDPSLAFWFIGNFYCGDATELCSDGGFWRALYGRSALDYFAAYAARVPASVPIMWTGPAVFAARITEQDAIAFRELVDRPVVLWDNFPVNDTLPGQIFLGPYVGREPGALRALHGVVLNLMSQAAANRIPLATAGDFFADPDRYEPDAALARAVATVVPQADAARELAAFVALHRGHPVLASGDTASTLGAHVAAFAHDHDAATLHHHLEELAGNGTRLERALAGDPLWREIEPWCAQLTRQAAAALAGLDALAGRGTRDAYDAGRAALHGHDHVVAATVLPPSLAPFVAGQGETVDRFADLFAILDRRLAG
jgi:hyaluronoglucosaminidase